VKVWIETRTLDFPSCVVLGRFGASYMDVAYERWQAQWFWVQPRGVSERIPEPSHIFVEQSWATEHTLETPRAKLHKATKLRRKKGAQQLALEL